MCSEITYKLPKVHLLAPVADDGPAKVLNLWENTFHCKWNVHHKLENKRKQTNFWWLKIEDQA